MKYIIINTKNYFDKYKMEAFINKFKDYLIRKNVILCPSSVYFSSLQCNNYSLCSQDFSLNIPFNNGISIDQLISFNIKYCIVGHADNRDFDNQNKNTINQKLEKLLKQGIVPILCIGEKEKNNNIENKISTIFAEMNQDLKNISTELVNKIIFAYEPRWAINENIELDFEEIKTIISKIKENLILKYNIKPIVMYGGNVGINNIKLLNNNLIDGFLIGSACTNYCELMQILEENT